MLFFPSLIWLGILHFFKLVFRDGFANPAFPPIAMFSGVLIAFLAIASVGILARRDGAPTHFANVLTGSVIATYLFIDPARFCLLVFPHLAVPALAVATTTAIVIWLLRRKNSAATGQS